jgi:hypothetical protein
MIEEDIKTMANPSKIASIYVKFITDSIDDPKKKTRLYSLLDSLTSIMLSYKIRILIIFIYS